MALMSKPAEKIVGEDEFNTIAVIFLSDSISWIAVFKAIAISLEIEFTGGLARVKVAIFSSFFIVTNPVKRGLEEKRRTFLVALRNGVVLKRVRANIVLL